MDGRLYLTAGKRLRHVLKTDCPELALALTAYERGKCRVNREFIANITVFRLQTDDGQIDISVRGDDWLKIEPLVKNGAWNTQITPVPQIGFLRPERALVVSALPVNDQALYLRILDDLEMTFPQDYPTSPL